MRRADIDRVKGVAILLVVFGHLVARADPAGVVWYEPARRAIYAFHMPLFLYLSGLVAAFSGMVLAPRDQWRRVFAARAQRLLLPFLAMGLIIVTGKLAAARLVAVDNPPAGFWSGLRDLVWHTAASPALSIWYLFVLFTVSIGGMVLLDGRAARLPWLLAGTLLLYALPTPAYVYLDRVTGYAVFFLAGVAAGLAGARWEAFMDRSWPWLAPPFAAGLVMLALFGAHWPEKYLLLPLGLLSMPVFHGCLRCFPLSSPLRDFLAFIGRSSFVIYLFNTLFIGAAKGVMARFWSWDGAHFWAFAAVLMVSGVAGPMLLKRAVLRRHRFVDRLTS